MAGDGFLIAVLQQSHATHVEDWFGKTADSLQEVQLFCRLSFLSRVLTEHTPEAVSSRRPCRNDVVRAVLGLNSQ